MRECTCSKDTWKASFDVAESTVIASIMDVGGVWVQVSNGYRWQLTWKALNLSAPSHWAFIRCKWNIRLRHRLPQTWDPFASILRDFRLLIPPCWRIHGTGQRCVWMREHQLKIGRNRAGMITTLLGGILTSLNSHAQPSLISRTHCTVRGILTSNVMIGNSRNG